MQNNYTDLYAYIGDNPQFSTPNTEKKDFRTTTSTSNISSLLWRNTEKLLKEQDAFWKAIVKNDDIYQLP